MRDAPTLRAAPAARGDTSAVSGDGEHTSNSARMALNPSTELSVEQQPREEQFRLRDQHQEQPFQGEDMHPQKPHERHDQQQCRLQQPDHRERQCQPPVDKLELQGLHEQQQQLPGQGAEEGEIASASISLLSNVTKGKSLSTPAPFQLPATPAVGGPVTCDSSNKETDEGASARTVLFEPHLHERKSTSDVTIGVHSSPSGVSNADRRTADADEKFCRTQRDGGGAKAGVSAAEGVSNTGGGACSDDRQPGPAAAEAGSDGGAEAGGVNLAAEGLGRAAGTRSSENRASDGGRGTGTAETKVSNSVTREVMDSDGRVVSSAPGGGPRCAGSEAGTTKDGGVQTRGEGAGASDQRGGKTTTRPFFLAAENGCRSAESAAGAVGGGCGSTERKEEMEGFADANIYVVHPPSLVETGLLPLCSSVLQQQDDERRNHRRHRQYAQEDERVAPASDATCSSADAATEKRRTRKCRSARAAEGLQAASAANETAGQVQGHDVSSAVSADRFGTAAAAAGAGEDDYAAPVSLCGVCRQEDDGMQSELLRICKDLILSNRIRGVQWNNPQVLQGQRLQLAVVVMPAAGVGAAEDAAMKKWREKYASLSIRVDLVPAGAAPSKSGRGKPSALSCQFWEAQAFPIDTQETVTVSVSPFSYSMPPAATHSPDTSAAVAAAAASCAGGPHLRSASVSAGVRDSHHGRQQIEQQQHTRSQQQQRQDEQEAEEKARGADEAGGSASSVTAATVAEGRRRRQQPELSRRFSEDYLSARVAEEEEEEGGAMSSGRAQPTRDILKREESSAPSRTSQRGEEQQQQQPQSIRGRGAAAIEAEHATTELFCYIADVKIPMTVNPQYLGKPLELELFLTILRPAEVDLVEHVAAMRDSVQLPLNAWAACHGLSCMHTASMQSALCAPTVDLLAVPFSSCFTGGRYGPFQRLQAAVAVAAAAATGTPAAATAAGGAGENPATAAPGGGQAEKNGVAASAADSAAALGGSNAGRGHQTDPSGRTERRTAADGKGDTTAGSTRKETIEEQENKDEAVLTQNWWAPPNINRCCSGPAAVADVPVHGDRISRTMELLVQSFASLATTDLKKGRSLETDERDLSQPQQHRIVCPLSVHRPLQVTTALVDSFMYVQIENVTERTAIRIENVVLRSVHSYAEGDLPVLLHAGDQYSVLLRLDDFFLSHQAPKWDSKSSSSGTAGEGAGGGAAGGRTHARGAGGGGGGSSLKGKYCSSGKVVLPLCLKWQVEGFFLSGTPAVWSQFGAECQLPTRTPLQVSITCLAAAAASEIFTAVLSVANNEAQEVELLVLLPRDIHYQQQAQTYQQQHYGKPFMLQEPKQVPSYAPGDAPPLIPLTSKKDLGRIPPGGSQSTYLQFLATRSGPHPLPPILLLDRKNNRKILARGGQVVVVS